MLKSESITNLATALNLFQSQVEGAKKSSENPFYKSKYADLAEIWKTIRQPLTANGLSVIQTNIPADNGQIIIDTMLLHNSGEWIASEGLKLQLVKIDPQEAGKAITYARRYALAAILGIHQEDDDGNSHISPSKITKRQDSPELTAVKNNAITELKSMYPGGNIPDNIILKIDNCRNDADVIAVIDGVRAKQNNKQMSVDELRAACHKGLEVMSYDPKHSANSQKKHLGCYIDDCADSSLLTQYLTHLRQAFRDKNEEVDNA